MRPLRVLVVGSAPAVKASDGPPNSFSEACADIGGALAERGWSISVGSDKPSTADALVVEGARRGERGVKVYVHYHDHEEIPFRSEMAGATANIEFIGKPGEGNWTNGRIKQIRESDVVLLIGGGDKTAGVRITAQELSKPWLPVPGFGGASGEIWKLFVESVSTLPLDPQANLRSQVEPWRGKHSADALLDFTANYVAAKPYSAKGRSSRILLLAILAVATAGWATLFFARSAASGFALFGILVASAVMGTGLHWFLRLLDRRDLQESSSYLWARAGAAIFEAFALFLLLLVGAISINGDVSFLDALSERTEFMRVAAISSLFGLASGFLTETIKNLLVKQFKTIVGGSTSSGEGADQGHDART